MQLVNQSNLIREPASEKATFKSTGQSMKTHWVKVNYTIVVVSWTQKIKKKKIDLVVSTTTLMDISKLSIFSFPEMDWIIFSVWDYAISNIYHFYTCLYLIHLFLFWTIISNIRDTFLTFQNFPSYKYLGLFYSFFLINKYVFFNYINYVYWHNEVFPFDLYQWFNWKTQVNSITLKSLNNNNIEQQTWERPNRDRHL